MRLDRFTTVAQEVLANAQSAAVSAGHAELSPLHVLVALLDDRNAVAVSILARAGVDANRVRSAAETELKRLPTVSGAQPQTGSSMIVVIQQAEKEAKSLGYGRARR